MTGDSMKSDITVETRYRGEGRPSYLRRRTSRPIHIDPEDTDLSLAIQESLKYAQLHEQKNAAKENACSGTNGTKKDDNNASRTGKDTPTDGLQENNLRELMLLHIDYIQQQEKVIAEKEKENKSLKSERDALQCRLDRMERRIAVLKQKEDALLARETNLEMSAIAPPTEKGIKRRQMNCSKNGYKKYKAATRGLPRVRGRGKQRRSYRENSSEDETSDQEEDDNSSSASESGVSGREVEDSSDAESQEESVEETEFIRNEDILTTKKMYHMDASSSFLQTDPQEPAAPGASVSGDSISAVEKGSAVEVPSWRRHVVTNLYQMEGTENIEDDEYRRRHAKPEAEERRRKRWDMQQMREQSLLERQRRREQAELPAHMKPKPFINSFFPNPEDITHIEVTEDLPVLFCGRPLPRITQQDFQLPWKVVPRTTPRLGAYSQRRK